MKTIGYPRPIGSSAIEDSLRDLEVGTLARLKRAIMATPLAGPEVAAYSALNVTRGASNGSPVSAGIQLVNGSYANATAMVKAGRLWSRFANSVDTRYGVWSEVWSKPTGDGSPQGISFGASPLHFIHDGQYFETLLSNANPTFTILADGKYIYPKAITKGVTNGADSAVNLQDGQQNCWVKIDFGSRAMRKISMHSRSGGGLWNFALAGVNDSLQGWDRSSEPWAVVLTDSYGQTAGTNWNYWGPYREALARLGIVDVLTTEYGGTGYQPTAPQPAEANSGRSRIVELSRFANPDICLIALGINDNAGSITDAVYSTTAAALAGFTSAVNSTLTQARANGANSVLVVMAPWFPSQGNANFTNATQGPGWKVKSDIILSTLQTIAGPWVYVDPFTDKVLTSNGYTYGPFGTYNAGAAAGPNPSGANWWTGTGTTGTPAGNGNSDLYSTDGVHPNTVAGYDYLAARLAAVLRQAILAL